MNTLLNILKFYFNCIDLNDFLANQKKNLKQLFLVHGEYETQIEFKGFLETKGFENISIPYLGEEIKLE